MAARRLFSTCSLVFREFLVSKPGMFAKVIDGKAIGAAVRREVREEIQQLVSGGRTCLHLPTLTVQTLLQSRTPCTLFNFCTGWARRSQQELCVWKV